MDLGGFRVIAGTHNFTINQGTTFSRRLRIKNSEGEPFDLTGYQARMQIRRQLTDSSFYVELSTENGRITLEPEDGVILLYMSDDITRTIPKDGVYDLEIESEVGEVFRVIEGKVRLKPEVTR